MKNEKSLHWYFILRNASFRLKQFQIVFSCVHRNFQVYMDKAYLRPLLEHNLQIWSPHLLGDIDVG